MPDVHKGRSVTAAGAPDEEIEISPAMIDAGARELMTDDRIMMSDLSLTFARAYALDVLRAAFRAR